jgi:hypothetical protein
MQPNDLPEQLDIEVTAEDIAHGLTRDCQLCPIALAARRAVPEATELHVGDTLIEVKRGRTWAEYVLPEQATGFILDFDAYGNNEDRAGNFPPFSFKALRLDKHQEEHGPD